MPSAELGEFLRTRRARVMPSLLGINDLGHRRVPGLRRDEVASDAGVSVDYYRRLEQGREHHPSEQVLASLSATLRLSADEQRHLYSLSGVAWRLDENARERSVPGELLALLESWTEAGAIILDPVLDISAMNAGARDLFGGFSSTRNLLEMLFLDPWGRSFFIDWDASAESTVANLRASADFIETPARFHDLQRDLHAGGGEFGEFWARHDVRPKTHETKQLLHHERGILTIDFHAFGVASAPGHQLLVYRERPRDLS